MPSSHTSTDGAVDVKYDAAFGASKQVQKNIAFICYS